MGSLMGKSETVEQTVRPGFGPLTSDYRARFLGHKTVRPIKTVRHDHVLPHTQSPRRRSCFLYYSAVHADTVTLSATRGSRYLASSLQPPGSSGRLLLDRTTARRFDGATIAHPTLCGTGLLVYATAGADAWSRTMTRSARNRRGPLRAGHLTPRWSKTRVGVGRCQDVKPGRSPGSALRGADRRCRARTG